MHLFGRRIPLFPLVVFTASIVWFLFPALTGQRTFAAVDMVESGAPYRDAIARPPDIESPIQTDQAETFSSISAFFREVRSGHWPRWDNSIAGGTPTGILPVGGLLSPFSAGYLVFPPWYAAGLKVALILLFCQWMTYLLLRRLGVGVVVATLGGLAYAYCGTNLVLIHRVSATALLPALLWAGHRMIGAPSVRSVAVSAGFVTWAWFEGFPSAWVYCLYVFAAWCGWLGLRRMLDEPDSRHRIRSLMRSGVVSVAAIGTGCALAAINLVPFVSEILARDALEHRVSLPLPAVQQFGLLNARALGGYPTGSYWSGPNPVESASNAGLVVVIAAVIGLVVAALGRARVTRAGADAWRFLLVLGGIVFAVCYHDVPILSNGVESLPGIADNPITRTRFILNLALVVIAALTVDQLRPDRGASAQEEPFDTSWGRWLNVGAVIALTYSMAAAANDYVTGARMAEDGDEIRGAFMTAALVTLVMVVVVVAWTRLRGRLAPLAGLAAAVVLFIQLAPPYREFTPASPVRDFYTRQAGHDALQALTGDRYRFAATGLGNFMPNSAQWLNLIDLRGQAIYPPAFKRLIEAAGPDAFKRDPLKVIMTAEEWNLASPIYDDLAVGYFVLGTDEKPLAAAAPPPAAPTSWTPVDQTSALDTRAAGPVAALDVPLRRTKGCIKGTVTVAMRSAGRLVDATSRPVADINGNALPFAVAAGSLTAGDRLSLRVSTSASCRIEVGTMSDAAPAIRLLAPDPALPLVLAATEQGWIYRRIHALPIVRAHTQWQSFSTQASALRAVAQRDPRQVPPAALVGRHGSSSDSGEVRVEDVAYGEERVRFKTVASTRAIAVVAQNVDRYWHATVDGKKASLVRVDGALAGVFVPPGSHHVELAYRPTHFYSGVAVSAATATAIAAVLGWPYLRRRRRHQPTTV